ncbi:Domain of uncharacterised function (DUF397) [Mycobacterium tuberculosis]|nr:Domain of uncharacterised function (DUF397) [Mycobacterium tuberculosis]
MKRPHVHWRKSSHSAQEGNCVEVGAWHKSSRSTDQGHCIEVQTWRTSSRSRQEGHSVEVAAEQPAVLARDSKDPDGPVLGFGAEAWDAFLTTVKSGNLDLTR